MFKVVRAQRQLSNYKFNVFIFELQFLKHGDKILLSNSVIAIFDVFEGGFKLIRIGAGHLSNPHDHIFLLTLLHKLEIINNFSQFRDQNCICQHLVLIYLVFLVAIAQKWFGVIRC